jgi:hypothetical protein
MTKRCTRWACDWGNISSMKLGRDVGGLCSGFDSSATTRPASGRWDFAPTSVGRANGQGWEFCWQRQRNEISLTLTECSVYIIYICNYFPSLTIWPSWYPFMLVTDDDIRYSFICISRNEDPAVYPGARDVNLQSFGASTGSTPSRGRMLHEETRGARTRSLSPGPRGHALASSYASPAGDLGFGPWSTVKRVDDLKSRSQPLPLPPAPITIGFLAPSSLPIASSLSQSPWKKGKLLGSGTFGQVYLGFNRYERLYVSLFNLGFPLGKS